MSDQTAFEASLTDAYARYVAAAPVGVDPRLVAATAATGSSGRRRGSFARSIRGRRLGVLVAVGLLVIALAVGAALAGSSVTPRPTALPTSAPSAAIASPPSSQTSDSRGVFTRLPDMSVSRSEPVVVTLADGRVLIAAGQDSGGQDVPAEVLDVDTLQYETITHGTPSGQRGGSGVLLPDGRVFVIAHDGNETASRAYLIDPRSMTSHVIPTQGFSNAPIFGVNPTMTLLHDGRVLIAGGQADVYKSTLLATAQLFDPSTETFTPTGSMAVPRWRHSMTTLPDGRVLVAGGEGTADVAQPSGDPIPPVHLAEAEIYDPQTGRFTPAGAMSHVRGETMAVPLPDGSVVVLPQWGASSAYRSDAVGLPPTYDPTGQVPVEIYDPTSGTFASGGTTPGIATTATLLGSGRILLTGNVLTSNGIAPLGKPLARWAVIYDPLSGWTETTASPPAAFSTPVALSHGQQVLFVGGRSPTLDGGNVDAVPWVEIFQ